MSDSELIRAPRKFIMPVAGAPARVVRWGEALDDAALSFAARAGYLTPAETVRVSARLEEALVSAAPAPEPPPVADDASAASWIESVG